MNRRKQRCCDFASTIKMLRPEDVWHPRIGAPVGNRNHRKHGGQSDECKLLRRLIADWRRQTNALLLMAGHELGLAQAPSEADLPATGPPKIFTAPLEGSLV